MMNGNPKHQSGFTMVELMVATTVGLFLVTGLLSAYLSVAKTYRYQEAMSQVQEAGRFLLTHVNRSFRNAGFGATATTEAIKGYGSVTTATAEIPASKIISQTARILKGDILYIPETSGKEIAYYTANFDGKAEYPTLYLNKEPLLEGVQEIKGWYGIDNDGDHQIDRFEEIANVTDWSQVKAVRLSFLVTNLEGEILSSKQPLPLPFGDGSTLAPDRRLYRSFTTTIALRNKMTNG